MSKRSSKKQRRKLAEEDCLGSGLDDSRNSIDHNVVEELKNSLRRLVRPLIQPKPFSIGHAGSFKDWLSIFDQYAIHADLDDDGKKLSLISLLEGDACRIAAKIPQHHILSYEAFVSALKDRIEPKLSSREYRHLLRNRKPKSSENALLYADALLSLVSKAYPDDINVDSILLDHFVETVRLSEGLSRTQLLQMTFQSSEEAIAYVRSWETASRSQSSITVDSIEPCTQDTSANSGLEERLDRLESMVSQCCTVVTGQRKEYRQIKCFKCDRLGHIARNCKMNSILCFRCNKPGHISRNCFQGNGAAVGNKGATNQQS